MQMSRGTMEDVTASHGGIPRAAPFIRSTTAWGGIRVGVEGAHSLGSHVPERRKCAAMRIRLDVATQPCPALVCPVNQASTSRVSGPCPWVVELSRGRGSTAAVERWQVGSDF